MRRESVNHDFTTPSAVVAGAVLSEPPETRKFYTTTEQRVLREVYPSGGVEACMPQLPRRSRSSIYQQAAKMGLHFRQNYKSRHLWTTSESIDRLITETYLNHPEKQAVLRLAERVMRPRWWVSRRAAVLGLVLPRFKEPCWTATEITLLEQHATKTPDVISRLFRQAGYPRTRTAIVLKLKRLSIDTTDPDHYTANALAALMGVDRKTVTRWIEAHGLVAKRRGTQRDAVQGGDQWWIARRAVREFIANNAAHIDLHKVDKFWFIDFLIGEYQ